jgi:putative transposase
MSQSLSRIAIHITFSTKSRNIYFTDKTIREELHAYIGGTCEALGCTVVTVGGTTDHVHILCLLGRTITISDLIKEIKIESSKWLKTKSSSLKRFSWQNGYGVFSVSDSLVENVKNYIRNQEEHHRRRTFQEEYRIFLFENNVPYDERYLWD